MKYIGIYLVSTQTHKIQREVLDNFKKDFKNSVFTEGAEVVEVQVGKDKFTFEQAEQLGILEII